MSAGSAVLDELEALLAKADHPLQVVGKTKHVTIRNDKPGPNPPGTKVGWLVAEMSGVGEWVDDYAALMAAAVNALPALIAACRAARKAINGDGAVILAHCKAADEALRAVEGNTYEGPCLGCDHFEAHDKLDGAGCTAEGCDCKGRETRNKFLYGAAR